ncbi:MAG: hypothetical protein IPG93_19950 [Burkholderiales bacterium]|nr:hypothetical protein [Burkholderiales bacterium]
MVLVAVGWLYVALMMALAELVHPNGGALGALVTFVLYGLAPVGLLMYLMATPLRKKARLKAELATTQAQAINTDDVPASASITPYATDVPAPPAAAPNGSRSVREPDAGSHAPGAAAVAPMRKEV